MADEQKTNVILISTLIACVFGLSVFILSICSNDAGPLHAICPNSIGNAPFYALVIQLTIVSFVPIRIVVKKCYPRLPQTIPVLPILFIALIGVVTIPLYDLFGWQCTLLGLVGCISICLFSAVSPDWKIGGKYTEQIKLIAEYGLVAICAAAIFVRVGVETTFGSGPDGDVWYSLHHSSAVIDSIFNAYYGTYIGYDGLTEQYGHYSLVLLPILKVSGLSTAALYTIFGIISAFSIFCIYYFVRTTVRSFGLRIIFISVGLVFLAAYWDHLYWQNNPIRLLFPCLILALCAFIHKHVSSDSSIRKKTAVCICMILLSLVALFWNTDQGAVCTIVSAIFLTAHFTCMDTVNVKKIGMMFVNLAVFFLILSAIQVGALEAVSLAANGHLASMEQIFGFILNGAYIDHMETELFWFHMHTIIMISALGLFIFQFCARLYKIDLSDHPSKLPLYAQIQTMCAGMLTKHIIRPISDTDIADLYFIVILVIFMDLCLFYLRDRGGILESFFSKRPVGFKKYSQAAFALVCCTVLTFTCVPTIYEKSNGDGEEYGFERTPEFYEFIADIGETIDPDTYGVGVGIQEIYIILGLKNMSLHFGRHENLSGHEYLLIYTPTQKIPKEYELIKVFIYRNLYYYYYHNTLMA